MLKRDQALVQLNLLRSADSVVVQSTAETVLWLSRQLELNEICPEQYRNLVQQHCEMLDQVDHPVCQVCIRSLQDLLTPESPV